MSSLLQIIIEINKVKGRKSVFCRVHKEQHTFSHWNSRCTSAIVLQRYVKYFPIIRKKLDKTTAFSIKHPQLDGALVWDQLAHLYHNTNMCGQAAKRI